jgi:hypothetical protein
MDTDLRAVEFVVFNTATTALLLMLPSVLRLPGAPSAGSRGSHVRLCLDASRRA